ncbi:isoleucyl-tRNA synthetase [Metschnikowia bicuspidata]|uniref:isoleucine--tRNA ligase n=1 Tax=Metschnikowia bicuspidata TaxID=27322 RepID=A0A4P9ZFF6_9ASCO|nr:isoleucyl-tRNA synthetase [Metschnikowia bicuspidata]
MPRPRFFSVPTAARATPPLYSHTLLLPKTSFDPHPPTDKDRSRLIAKSSQELYKWQLARPNATGRFVLHDGPPYANGDLHLGHALNKTLKDIVNRYQLLRHDSRVSYVPGWDCHGLPIEMKVAELYGRLSTQETRARCRQLAQTLINRQRTQFEEFAIMTDFDTRYVTMDAAYEARQLRLFAKLFETGLLTRQLKPVWWGCETRTALAEAELEYNPAHHSTAVHVRFPLADPGRVVPGAAAVSVLIWTSTLWTIPANKAICVNRDVAYTALRHVRSGEYVVVAAALADTVAALDPAYEKTSVAVSGAALEGLHYQNPCAGPEEWFPILHGDHVVDTAGTGLVHNAPAHGAEDHAVGKTHGLQIASVVDEGGFYIEAQLPVGLRHLTGKYANGKSAIKQVLDALGAHCMLHHVDTQFVHSYPYDWRSKTPVIQRATPQWFINVECIKETAVALLEQVQFVPEAGRARIVAFLRNRTEWCISRQRQWGVPLPIVYHKGTGEPVEDVGTIRHIVARIEALGTDEWFVDEPDASRWLPAHMGGANYYKEKDTMDVWFDSGVSWMQLVGADADWTDTTPLADVYLEGSDQHRGWFQSSMLNRVIASGDASGYRAVAPFKKIVTHGFTLDKNNDKMSKSHGNVILPQQVIRGGGKPYIPALGTDGLRLWAASCNYTLDVSVSAEVLQRVQENVKKLRVTFKYLLGNVLDLEVPAEYHELSPLDKWVLTRLYRLQNTVDAAYSANNYARVVRQINSHMAGDLSAVYFDISKDCLYTDQQASTRRRAIQTVLSQVLCTYTGLLAPIQPLLAQEVWECGFEKRYGVASSFMMPWSFFAVDERYANEAIEADMAGIWVLRDAVFKQLERMRSAGYYKNRLELEIYLTVGLAAVTEYLKGHREYLADYFLVSAVHLRTGVTGDVVELPQGAVTVRVARSAKCKCPRCWKHVSERADALCGKCAEVVNSE